MGFGPARAAAPRRIDRPIRAPVSHRARSELSGDRRRPGRRDRPLRDMDPDEYRNLRISALRQQMGNIASDATAGVVPDAVDWLVRDVVSGLAAWVALTAVRRLAQRAPGLARRERPYPAARPVLHRRGRAGTVDLVGRLSHLCGRYGLASSERACRPMVKLSATVTVGAVRAGASHKSGTSAGSTTRTATSQFSWLSTASRRRRRAPSCRQ